MSNSRRIDKLFKRLEKRNPIPKVIVVKEGEPIPEHDESTVVIIIRREFVSPGGWSLNGK